MRIQHNIPAMNAYRNYTANTKAVSKNLEKLSSGYAINRAGDNAAGLAISEKMRAQITGLEVAQKNAKDGISLIQTGEGALTEVHSMLNRMTELAMQSANGTFDDPTDRANLQKEVVQLKSEIDRISDSANFNGIKLLDGSLASNSSANEAAKQMMDIQAFSGAGVATSDGRQDAIAEAKVYNAAGGALGANNAIDAFEISFVNSKGETKTIRLVEGVNNAIADANGATIAGALSGSTSGLTLTGTNNDPKDLAEFRELFNITGVDTAGTAGTQQGVKIQAKDATSGASIKSFKYATGANSGAAETALNTATALADDISSTKAEAAGYAVDFDTDPTANAGAGQNIVNGATFKIGDTVYELSDGLGPVKDGNVGIALGATDKASVQNLLAQLKKDGFDVEVSANDASKLIFSKPEQLMKQQGGTEIVSSSENVLIDKVEASKQKINLTVGAGTAGTQKLTFSYVDENGEPQTKEISYTGTGAAGTNADAIAKAISDDADLVKLFKIEHTAGQTGITIEARGTGNDAGRYSGISTSDGTTLASTITAGTHEGKTVSLKTGENFKNGNTITIGDKTYEFSNDANKPVGSGNVRVDLGANGGESMKNLSEALDKAGVKHSIDANGKMTFNDKDGVSSVKGGLVLQIGESSDDYNQLTISIDNMDTKTLGIADINIGTQEGAKAAMDLIKNAINSVSSTRGDLGAAQNRLDHTINNLAVTQENIQDAEASIRDVDVAKEMMAYTKNNILVQSAQAMLAQANQLPQGVLQLLG